MTGRPLASIRRRRARRAGPVLVAGLFACTLSACGSPDQPAPPAVTAAADAPAPWLAEVARASGIDFDHAAGRTDDYATPEITGSGGALFDYDGDGDLDVYLVNAGGGSEPPANRLYRQEGVLRFRDVTASSGLGDTGYGMGAVFGDVDNDGDQDVLVTNLGPDVLYLNRGDGSFAPAPPTAGVGIDAWSTSACFLDYDRDGHLDLYVATYLRFDPDKRCTDSAGNPEFCGPEAFRGLPDLLFRGLGDGRFEEVSRQALAGGPANKGLGVLCADLDGDDLIDVYVANDGEQNQLWINRGDGTFGEQALLLGAALNLFGKPEASMGVAAGDLDGDLDLDLFMTHLDRETNTFYANLGEAGFEDRTPASGLGPASLSYTGFGTALFDADHDGDLDLASVNGRVRRGASLSDRRERRDAWVRDPSLPEIFTEYAEPDLFFVNQGGASFRDASAAAGWRQRPVAVGRGLLVDDADEDGDPDLLVANCGGAAHLFRNDIPGKGHWSAVEAIDLRLRRDALGAGVIVETAAALLLRPLVASYGYLSATRPRAHFGLGAADRVVRVEIRWPDGGRSVLNDLPADRLLRVLRPPRESAR